MTFIETHNDIDNETKNLENTQTLINFNQLKTEDIFIPLASREKASYGSVRTERLRAD